MNNPNAIKIKKTQENIDKLEHRRQELIHEFSTISMLNATLEGQQKNHQKTSHRLQQQINSIPVSDEDFDHKIKQLEEELATELLIENELIALLTEKSNILKNRSLIKELQQSMSQTFLHKTNEITEKIEAKVTENIHLSTQIKESEILYQEQVQENQDLEDQYASICEELTIQETNITKIFQAQTLESFLCLDLIELKNIQKQTTQLDLFYAVSLRLGIIYDFQKQNQKAFKYLSYLPPSLLQWYQIYHIYEKNKLLILTQYLLPYSSRLLFNRASFPVNDLEREIFLILSIQASTEHQEVNQPPYLSLLQFYLDQQFWLQAYILIEKIRNLDVRPAKSCLPIKKIKEAFSKTEITHPEQMHQIMALIPELQDIEVFKNSHPASVDSSLFLALWSQYQQGVELMKIGELTLAQLQFHEILSQHPYFIEAYLKLAECNSGANWQHLAIRKGF